MKHVALTALFACCAASAFGQDAPKPAAPPAPAAAQAPASKPAATEPDPKAVKEAEEMLAAVAKTYHGFKSLSDTMKVQMNSPMGEQAMEAKVAFGPDNAVFMSFPGMSFTAVEGTMYVQRDDVKDKYYAVKMEEGGFGPTLEKIFGGEAPLPPQLCLHASDKQDKWLESLTMGGMGDMKIVGHQESKTEAGDPVNEILLASDVGKVSVQVEPKTNLLKGVKMVLSPMGADEGMTQTTTITMSPVADKLDKPIAFAAGDRKKVESIDKLEPTAVEEGQAAPDFTLQTLAGEEVTLSKLKGSVVVLDFWATWCGPCKMALPKVNEFAKWAVEAKQPIKVYAVNVWERFKSPEETKTKVSEFWKSKDYGFPTLLDLQNDAIGKYGFNGIPATVIVGPDGKIFKIHIGFDEGIVDELKKNCADAMKTTG